MVWRGVGVVAVVFALSSGAATARPAAGAPVGLRVFRFVDQSRVAVFGDGTRHPRTLVTYVRYPRRGRGPFPLVVFGHGFAVLPRLYGKLLDAWTRAGYVVAAPVFPVENAHAPGGPDESDLSNQPGDMSFVISRLVTAAADAGSPLHGLETTSVAEASASGSVRKSAAIGTTATTPSTTSTTQARNSPSPKRAAY